MKEDRHTFRAEEIHSRWCRANLDHKTEIAMMAKALREAYFEGVNAGRESVVAKGGGVEILAAPQIKEKP